MTDGATFSRCRLWRYSLWRTWDEGARKLVVIGLNPSTADETINDPTIRRCIDFAKRWELGGLHMLNLFGYRATKPMDMFAADDPVGPGNRGAFDHACLLYPMPLVLCAWGTHGSHKDQDMTALEWLRDAGINTQCLDVTKHGMPRHPLYIPAVTVPTSYVYRERESGKA